MIAIDMYSHSMKIIFSPFFSAPGFRIAVLMVLGRWIGGDLGGLDWMREYMCAREYW